MYFTQKKNAIALNVFCSFFGVQSFSFGRFLDVFLEFNALALNVFEQRFIFCNYSAVVSLEINFKAKSQSRLKPAKQLSLL